MKSCIRALSLLLIALTVLALACCSAPAENPAEPTTEPTAEPTVEPTAEPTPIPMTTAELASALSSTLYANAALTNTDKTVGLADASIVGPDYDKMQNETLYPVPADSEFVRIFNASDYGVSETNENNATAINNMLNEAKTVEGLVKVNFAPGTYKVGSTIAVNGQKDLYFVGEGVTFVCTGWFSFISYNNCNNVHFNGFALDFDPSPVVTGYIVSCTAGSAKVRIDEEFDLSNPIYGGAKKVTSYLEHSYDAVSGGYKPDYEGNIFLDCASSYDAETRILTVTFGAGGRACKEEGKRVSLAFANKQGQMFSGYNNDNMYWEHLTVYSNPGMVCYTRHGNNYYINHVNMVLKEGSTRLMTATSDGWHLVDIAGDVKVTNSYLTYNLDDALNILTLYRSITAVDGDTLTLTAGGSYDDLPFYEGNQLEVLSGVDLHPIGELYTVVSVTDNGSTMTVKLDRAVEGDVVGSLAANDSRASKLYLHNCVIGNKRNRGILAQCRKSEISNCTFMNILHGALSIHAVRDQYREGILPRDFLITNNKFFGNSSDVNFTCWGDGLVKNSAALTNIDVINNFFCANYSGSMNLMAASNCEIRHNMTYNVCRKVSENKYLTGIFTDECTDMQATDNLFYFDQKKAHFTVIAVKADFSENKNNKYYYPEG